MDTARLISGNARAARMNRDGLTSRMAALREELEALGDRDLSARKRAQVEGEIRASMRATARQYLSNIEGFVMATERELLRRTPAARQREAVFQRPERFTAMLAALSAVEDADLPSYGVLAREAGDDAALAAVASAIGGRPDASDDVRSAVETALVPREDDGFNEAIAELAVIRQELAASYLELGRSPVGTERDTQRGMDFARAGLEVDGAWKPVDLDAAHVRVGVERITGETSEPEQVPGTFVAW